MQTTQYKKFEQIQLQVIEERTSDRLKTLLVITNRAENTLSSNWRLYFSLGITPSKDGDLVKQTMIEGRYGYLEPTDEFPTLEKHQSARIEIAPWLFSGMELLDRQGFHWVEVNADGSEISRGIPVQLPAQLDPLTEPRLEMVHQFSPNSRSLVLPEEVDHDTIPSLIPSIESAGVNDRLSALVTFKHIRINADEQLHQEALVAETLLADHGLNGDDGLPLNLRYDPTLPKEHYELTINRQGISLKGQSQGIFYALQTLRQLLHQFASTGGLPEISVSDSPDFEHRAVFVDIARHYHSAESLKKLITAMSAFKLNRLQLGICNDEGWRLEIPEIPELHKIGSVRSYQVFSGNRQRRALYPAWGDGPEDYTGYLSGESFIDLLVHARNHHVEIILELNLPAHANALLRSLDDSDKYVLSDPKDESNYRSAQGYTNNVINPGMPDSYRVIKKIIEQVKHYYDSAEAPLSFLHLGGDELPTGAWINSPACQRLQCWNSQWKPDNEADIAAATHAVSDFHVATLREIVDQVTPGTRLGFWHEMRDHINGDDYITCWTTEVDRESIVDSIKTKDQPLVICNASYLYLDMPQALAPDEPGLPWAAYIDTETIFNFKPLDSWRITNQKSVLGLQAQLWSETVTSETLLHYYLFPRLIALAERAWNIQSSCNWSEFAAAIEQREQAYLTDLEIGYRPI